MGTVNFELLSQLDAADYWRLLQYWPVERPLLAFGGRGSQKCYLALGYKAVDPQICFSEPIHIDGSEQHIFPRYMGGVPYELFSPFASPHRARVFRIYEVLIFDYLSGQVHFASDSSDGRSSLCSWKEIEHLLEQTNPARRRSPSVRWQPSLSDRTYLKLVEKCLAEIRSGRYYQINLLRYFKLIAEQGVDWWPHFAAHAGPFAAWIRWSDFEMISMSPERFIQIYPENGQLIIRTDPIKGTISASKVPGVDDLLKKRLLNSEKDRAELSMIVDLMRNDLYRVCKPGSVIVKDPGSLHSFSTVHHLIAQIEGNLRAPLTLGYILSVLCPGGSITGAPKIEVMTAIRDHEQRNRGFFMGNCFIYSPQQGYFDSSILIRTVVREQGETAFAAGSGIVIHSQPELEMDEIWSKGRVVNLREGTL